MRSLIDATTLQGVSLDGSQVTQGRLPGLMESIRVPDDFPVPGLRGKMVQILEVVLEMTVTLPGGKTAVVDVHACENRIVWYHHEGMFYWGLWEAEA